ncbi:hypothetical protein PVAP13_9NG797700 [Panicum virgatum]|uniref:Uncharacterized protein n=1 Tax=Panicum virgatum TaxID=38727 RepID=A0A8T0N0R8_PANVG|nr:hypothetical protein PVAP13_9NG797700 [Panicum virgatum]
MIDSTAKKLPLGTLPTCGEELCRLPGQPAWSTVSLPNTRGGQARRIILRAPTMDACAHEYTTARARADTGGRSSQRQADRPSAATRRGPRPGPRIVPSGVAAAATHSPQLQLVVASRVSGWVGFGRGRGPPCQGQLAAVGRPAPATSAAYYAAARLGERETNRCLGSAPRELLLLHVVVSSASSSRASKGTAPPSLLWPRSLPCFASPPPVRRNAAATEKEKKKRACCFRVCDAACRGCGVGSTRSFSSGGGGSSSLA